MAYCFYKYVFQHVKCPLICNHVPFIGLLFSLTIFSTLSIFLVPSATILTDEPVNGLRTSNRIVRLKKTEFIQTNMFTPSLYFLVLINYFACKISNVGQNNVMAARTLKAAIENTANIVHAVFQTQLRIELNSTSLLSVVNERLIIYIYSLFLNYYRENISESK